jgi:CTP:phosphocholine cytidylyltransferase-like protein/thiamine kinase-like enzyme
MQALAPYRVDNAIILAAGFGTRLVPFTYDVPKALLKINGIPMIEHQIEQLIERGITEIHVVVGYLKECFDYLVEKYGVKLTYNPEYAQKNNFASLYCVREQLKNSYVLVADDWMSENIFNRYEYQTWICGVFYEGFTSEWVAHLGAHDRITSIDLQGADGWGMIGPAYFDRAYSAQFSQKLEAHYLRPDTANHYFEHIIRENLKTMPIALNRQLSSVVYEFEDLEQLRAFDPTYRTNTNNAIIQEIARVFAVGEDSITNIEPLKEGMTNQSFVFSLGGGDRYVFRLPGKGTDQLISRTNEKRVYDLLEPLALAEEIISFDATTGNRIARFYPDVRVADAHNDDDLALSMRLIRDFHARKLVASHRFDLVQMIDHYQGLCQEVQAIRFMDFDVVEQQARELLSVKERLAVPEILCHADAVPTNILIFSDGSCRLIDWEYAGMGDPIMDISMYGIYAYFDRARLDQSFALYLGRAPQRQEALRFYLHVALGGFLWSMWAEYKQAMGQEFGEYPLLMYRYMKDFYKLLKDEGYLEEDV